MGDTRGSFDLAPTGEAPWSCACPEELVLELLMSRSKLEELRLLRKILRKDPPKLDSFLVKVKVERLNFTSASTSGSPAQLTWALSMDADRGLETETSLMDSMVGLLPTSNMASELDLATLGFPGPLKVRGLVSCGGSWEEASSSVSAASSLLGGCELPSS